MAQITITWTAPTPAPTSYVVRYRRKGDVDWIYLNNVSGSPLVIDNVPSGQSWEGYITCKCGFNESSSEKYWDFNTVSPSVFHVFTNNGTLSGWLYWTDSTGQTHEEQLSAGQQVTHCARIGSVTTSGPITYYQTGGSCNS